jgi:DNA-binding NarL/FixJ family response regulator
VHDVLTSVEMGVREGLADGLQSKEIAVRVDRSIATVEFHVRALYLKLRARSRAQLVARAYGLGYLQRRDSASAS